MCNLSQGFVFNSNVTFCSICKHVNRQCISRALSRHTLYLPVAFTVLVVVVLVVVVVVVVIVVSAMLIEFIPGYKRGYIVVK